ncbi:acyltransferase [Diaphorobacter sp. HDW4A]|uniref:acyltransferase family protein n=1 Tax=Diaphorobacter sp. HDW4A TaxID=2714924 RepID=UPI0014088926|nr:acyltransferase [Diaphorobacter sp. HDW4A]QIL82998.1 acyltransferase [Diaphorobacter sp. HDW4A]
MHVPPPDHRFNNFDALRLVAALLVIWSHQFSVMGRSVPLILNGNEPGAVGVVLFFAISGYLVTGSWLADPHLLRFSLRRALRIWPGLCVAVLGCALILGPLTTTVPLAQYLRSPITWDYFSNLWLQIRYTLPGVFETNPLPNSMNGPLWTIPLEVTCYVGLAVLGLVQVTRTRWFAPITFLLLTGLLQWRYSPAPGQPSPEWSPLLQYSLMFTLGSSLACFRELWSSHRVLTAIIVTAAFTALHFFGPSVVKGQALLFIVASLGVIWGTACTPVLHHAGRFGDFSYGLYIYAFPIQQLVVWAFSNRLDYPAALTLTLIGTLTLAVLSWHFVERPALSLKPQRRPLTQPAVA